MAVVSTKNRELQTAHAVRTNAGGCGALCNAIQRGKEVALLAHPCRCHGLVFDVKLELRQVPRELRGGGTRPSHPRCVTRLVPVKHATNQWRFVPGRAIRAQVSVKTSLESEHTHDMSKDALHDTLRCIQLVRENADIWGLDKKRIGVVGFSAGATHSASAATEYPTYDARAAAEQERSGGGSVTTSRPDFVGVLFPGPTLFETSESKALTELGFGRFGGMSAEGAENQAALESQRELEIADRDGPPAIPTDVPPSFVASPGPGDKIHAAWALEFYSAMLFAGVPNIELILYAQGVHGQLPSGANGTGAWHARFVEWLSGLGFLAPKGVVTLASKHVSLLAAGKPVPQFVGPGNAC